MNCHLHPNEKAVGACTCCGNLICDDCLIKVENKNICKECFINEISSKENVKNQISQQSKQNKKSINKSRKIVIGIIALISIISIFIGFLQYNHLMHIPGNLLTEEDIIVMWGYVNPLVSCIILFVLAIKSMVSEKELTGTTFVFFIISIILYIGSVALASYMETFLILNISVFIRMILIVSLVYTNFKINESLN